MIAIPFLLMWALTGASYEFGFVENGWYAATPGGHEEYPDAVSKKLAKGDKTPDITPAAAIAAAQAKYPDRKLLNFDMPAKDDATGAYAMYFKDGYGSYGESTYPATSACTSTGTPAWRRTSTAHRASPWRRCSTTSSTTRCTPATS